MVEKTEHSEPNKIIEKAESIGQIIIGEVEKIGGILTADPITQAEGEFNIAAGTLRNESAEVLEETEEEN